MGNRYSNASTTKVIVIQSKVHPIDSDDFYNKHSELPATSRADLIKGTPRTVQTSLRRPTNMIKDPSVKEMNVISPRANNNTLRQIEEKGSHGNNDNTDENYQSMQSRHVDEKKYWMDLDASIRNSSWKYAEVSRAIAKPFTGAMRQFKVKKRDKE